MENIKEWIKSEKKELQNTYIFCKENKMLEFQSVCVMELLNIYSVFEIDMKSNKLHELVKMYHTKYVETRAAKRLMEKHKFRYQKEILIDKINIYNDIIDAIESEIDEQKNK